MAISRKGNRIIKPTQDIFLFAWRKETNKCCVMKLFARFFNDTSYTHHKTIFNQCIIFSRQMFFQTVFIILGDLNYWARVSLWQFNGFAMLWIILYHFWEIAMVSLAILRDDKHQGTAFGWTWKLCVKMRFYGRAYIIYIIKSVDIADFFCYITFRAA